MPIRPVATLLVLAIDVLQLILFVYWIVSMLEWWQQVAPRSAPQVNLRNPLVRWIEGVCYTILHPIRRVIEPYQRGYGIDFSIIIVFLLLGFLKPWVATLPF